MPKKKKQSRGNAGGDDGGVSARVDGTTGKDLLSTHPYSSAIPTFDVISLQLLKGSSSGGGKRSSLKYAPTLVIADADANALDVRGGEQVFVVSTVSRGASSKNSSGDTKVCKAAIAKIDIVDGGQDGLLASPRQSSVLASSPKSSKLNRGSCYLLPSSLSHSFLEVDRDASVTNPSTTVSSLTMAVASTPLGSPPSSASKSKFSFARGGGGDQMISPSSKTPSVSSTPPSAARVSKASSTIHVWIIPLDSDLGDRLVASLCRTARAVTVGDQCASAEVRSDQRSSFWKGGSLCQRLVVAHTVGEFLSDNMTFQVSYQGQTINCLVDQVTGRTSGEGGEEEDALAKDLEQLAIQSVTTSDATNAGNALLQALNATPESERRKILLYKVTRDTLIHFPIDSKSKNHTNENESAMIEISDSKQPMQMVAGLDATVEQLQSALETPLAHPEIFRSHLRPPKGVLLHGPGGVGKSCLALQVGQNLEAKGYHVVRVHCSVLQSQTAFVGQAERRLVQLFDSARSPRIGKSGCLLIFDDVNLICPRRQGTDIGADRLASTLLALLDGLEGDSSSTHTGVARAPFYPTVILAITTNPGSLDAALRRPGRLDSEIEVPLPDEPATRRKILEFQLRLLGAKANFCDAEWLEMARLAKGFTGADLKLAAKEALRCALLNSLCDADGLGSKYDSSIDLNTMINAIRSTKPSAIKAVTVEVPRVPWTSIGGMDEVKRQLREAIELPLTHASTFERFGVRPPRGVLLYGPPGCSKTLMARALATEGNMNFLAVKGPELLSKWLGESERALAALFRRARLASPAIIFFDEVDAIASKRGGSSSGGERLLSQLLTELDGIQSKDVPGKTGRVVIVCATNRPDLLDGALMRPGRIDRMIYVGVPDESSRDRILRIGLKGKSCADDVDVSFPLVQNMFLLRFVASLMNEMSSCSNLKISRLVDSQVSGGLSGAELIAACRDAALLAMEEYEEMEDTLVDPIVRMDHLMQSLTSMERQITPSMLDFYASFRGTSTKQHGV